MRVKYCTRCGIQKHFREFSRRYEASDGLTSHCKECLTIVRKTKKKIKSEYDRAYRAANEARLREARKIYYETNKDNIHVKKSEYVGRNKEKFRQYHADRALNHLVRAKKLLASAKLRAMDKGLEFSITLEYVHVMLLIGKCQKSNICFDLSPNRQGNRNPFAPSIDRKNNRKGYTFDNTQIVCNMYNMGKSEFDELDFLAMCASSFLNHPEKEEIINRMKELTK